MKPLLSVLFALLLLAPASAQARILTVDPSGGGDFTTIQGAIDAVQRWFGPPDTIVVNAGTYPEHLLLPPTDTRPLITCPAGAAATSVLGMTFAACTPSGSGSAHWIIRDLTVVERCLQGAALCLGQWQRCVFLGGYEGNFGEWGVPVSLSDCDFFDSVKLVGVRGPMRDLRFHSAPLTTEPRVGGLTYQRCRFTGEPGDTLVHAPRTEDLSFYSCVFDSAAVGIWAPRSGYPGFKVDSCTFRDVTAAVAEPAQSAVPAWGVTRPVRVTHSRFENCARAISWPGGQLTMVADTLNGCGDGAITAVVDEALLDQLVVTNNAGIAVDLEVARYHHPYGSVTVRGSSVVGATGPGLRMRKSPEAYESFVFIRSNRFEGCATGADIECTGLHASANVFFANSGDGFRFTSLSGWYADSISDNTSAANLGHGLALFSTESALPAGLAVARNVCADNSGDGFHYGAGVPGSHERNDSWQNGGQPYFGITPSLSELQALPRFCDLTNGDLSVSSDSPCAPAAPTGPMGALGVGCTLSVAGVHAAPGAIAFSVHPNPARGSVEFALPPGTRDGRLEVLDVQGRRVWGQAVAPGVAGVRWSGQLERGGRADAGLYWARCTSAAGVSTRRLVWLR